MVYLKILMSVKNKPSEKKDKQIAFFFSMNYLIIINIEIELKRKVLKID